jgi:hypothetical protein
MYVDESISPLEMLASSNNIGDYVDKQSYRSSVNDQLKQTIETINSLKRQLEQQKIDVERVLADQKNQREALVAKEAEQQRLMDETKGQEQAYQSLSAESQKRKQELQSQQDAEIRRAYGGGNGGRIQPGSLPGYAAWAGSCYVDTFAYSHGGVDGNGGDPLGYGCNQCVSYTAWKMAQVTGYAPSYWGNANMWPASAERAKFTVTSQPRAKALGVMSAGSYGHIVYIEAYHPETNTVDISQYNEWLSGTGDSGWGHYSTRSGVSASVYDTYIYL